MLWVSCSLFCWSRVISSWMLTAEPEGTCFSSSILASSSAIGCSKSRKFTAIGARGYHLPADRGHSGTYGWGAVKNRNPAASQQGLQFLDERRRGPHIPVGSEGIRAA